MYWVHNVWIWNKMLLKQSMNAVYDIRRCSHPYKQSMWQLVYVIKRKQSHAQRIAIQVKPAVATKSAGAERYNNVCQQVSLSLCFSSLCVLKKWRRIVATLLLVVCSCTLKLPFLLRPSQHVFFLSFFILSLWAGRTKLGIEEIWFFLMHITSTWIPSPL